MSSNCGAFPTKASIPLSRQPIIPPRVLFQHVPKPDASTLVFHIFHSRKDKPLPRAIFNQRLADYHKQSSRVPFPDTSAITMARLWNKTAPHTKLHITRHLAAYRFASTSFISLFHTQKNLNSNHSLNNMPLLYSKRDADPNVTDTV